MKIRFPNKSLQKAFTRLNKIVMSETLFSEARAGSKTVPEAHVMMAVMANPSRKLLSHPLRLLGVTASFIPEISPELYLTDTCEFSLTPPPTKESVMASVARHGAPAEEREPAWEQVARHNRVVYQVMEDHQELIKEMNGYARVSWRELQLTDPPQMNEQRINELEGLGFRDIALWPHEDDAVGIQATFDVNVRFKNMPIPEEKYTLTMAMTEDSITLLDQTGSSQYFLGHPLFSLHGSDHRVRGAHDAESMVTADPVSAMVMLRDAVSVVEPRRIFGRVVDTSTTFCAVCHKPMIIDQHAICKNCKGPVCADCQAGDYCKNCGSDKRLADYDEVIADKTVAELMEEL